MGRGAGLVVVLALALVVVVVGRPAGAAQPFPEWLAALRAEAVASGIGRTTVDRALAEVTPIPRVIELDRRQPEGRMTFEEYNRRVLSADRVAQGRRLVAEHRALLSQVAAKFGVQPRFIVALWGIETSYGNDAGDFPIVGALATLAHDGRRASFFRRELLQALRILDAGDVPIDQLRGSWAGAMGQTQFMPSSYLAHAVDFDGDGRRDIWHSLPDVFASIANYLAAAGWNDRYTWGRKVRVPATVDGIADGLQAQRSLSEWQTLGVRRHDGTDLPVVAIDAALLRPDDGAAPAYLVYQNFRVLMAWNRSTYFAITVGELADRIGHG